MEKVPGERIDKRILRWEIDRLRLAMQEATDLLAERRYGNAARSPGHNARLVLESALRYQTAGLSAPETPTADLKSGTGR